MTVTVWEECATCGGAGSPGEEWNDDTQRNEPRVCPACDIGGRWRVFESAADLHGLRVRFAAPFGRRVIVAGIVEDSYRSGHGDTAATKVVVRVMSPAAWQGTPWNVPVDSVELVAGGES